MESASLSLVSVPAQIPVVESPSSFFSSAKSFLLADTAGVLGEAMVVLPSLATVLPRNDEVSVRLAVGSSVPVGPCLVGEIPVPTMSFPVGDDEDEGELA